VLNGFTGISFNEQIVQFKKMDEEVMSLTKEEMKYKLSHNLPTSTESVEISKELNILRRAISSNGRGMSIRLLFSQIPNVLSRLCPCMLMSPISVAQYIEAKNDLVDIVVFDEASQLPTCKAVGVLARGKNAVIVGDPNQMPPTSFFAGNNVDEDNLDIEDLDSILSDCLALGMPESYLKWHYRSRHESLIAFSNREFYENRMQTFPSPEF
jgi:superfamily I DNA and/or RNA helicase